MASVRRQKGDKTRTTKNGNLVIQRANGTVVKINSSKNIVIRKKPDGTTVTQKWSPSPTRSVSKSGFSYGSNGSPAVKWNIESRQKFPTPQSSKAIRGQSGGR